MPLKSLAEKGAQGFLGRVVARSISPLCGFAVYETSGEGKREKEEEEEEEEGEEEMLGGEMEEQWQKV